MKTGSCHFHFPALSAGEDHIRLGPSDDRDSASANTAQQALFHAAWSKNAFLAEALLRLHPVPALLCDADVYLSAELKQRMEALLARCPERGMLYGVAGRRLCQRAPTAGVPRLRLERHRSVIGYVQYTRENDPGPWRTESQPWGGEHDDWRVYAQFGPERSVALPFGCYHVGGSQRHWGGFEGRLLSVEAVAESPWEITPVPLFFAGASRGTRVTFLADGGTDHALGLLRSVPGMGELMVVDPWELNQFTVERVEDLPVRLTGIAGWMPGKWEECRRRMLRGEGALPLSECVNPLFLDLIRWDREYTRERFQREVCTAQASVFSGEEEMGGELGKVKILGEDGVDPLTEVEEVDVIWLGGEIGYTPLMQDVPGWRKKFPAVALAPSKLVAEGLQLIRGGESCPTVPKDEMNWMEAVWAEPPAGSAERRTGWKHGVTVQAGLVCGEFHDVWAWPESTACVEMLLGTPEVITVAGEWMKRSMKYELRMMNAAVGELVPIAEGGGSESRPSYPLSIPLVVPERVVPVSVEYGIVFYQNDRGEGTVEGLMLSLHSLRKHWLGEIAVLFSGEESPSVRMACARYGALYREVPEPEVEGDPRVVRQVFVDPAEQVQQWGPYRRVLWVESGLIGREREFQKWAKRMGSAAASPYPVSTMTEAESRRMPPPDRVDIMRRDPGLESRQGEMRSALEVEVMLAWAATARVRYGATVVIGLLPEDLPGFEKNWTATRWRHAAMTLEDEPRIHEPVPALLGLCGVTEKEVNRAMRHRAELPDPEPWPDLVDKEGKQVVKPGPKESCYEVRLFSMDEAETAGAEPHWTYVLAEAAKLAGTEWLIYLDPMMHPSPGAELFLPHRLPGWGTAEVEKQVYAPGWAFRRIGGLEKEWVDRVFSFQSSVFSGVVPGDLRAGQILKHLRLGPSATMIRRTLMRDSFAEWRRAFTGIPFEIFLTLRLRRDIAPDPAAPPPQTQPPAPKSGKEPVPVSITAPPGMAICRPQDWGWNT